MIKQSSSEFFRLQSMMQYELLLQDKGFNRIAGVDEAGRGPLAGPVVAAACILPKGSFFKDLNDSKQLSGKKRDALFFEMTTFPDLIYGIGIVDVETIDRVNILQATFLAMQIAVKELNKPPDYILVDGNRSPIFEIPSKSIVKGDGLSLSIAAASIIAKVTRDRIMLELDGKWPQYGFKDHKGYGTVMHRNAIDAHGPSPYHRRSFDPVRSLLGTV